MNIAVKIRQLPNMGELEPIWRDLECRSKGVFFVSWAWIGVWLANLPNCLSLRLMQAEICGRIVGLGILARGQSKKKGNIPYCATEYLHETGVRDFDMVIEHNDFLLDDSCEVEARSAMIDHWLHQVDRVSELNVPGTSNGAWLSEFVDPGRYGMKRFDMTMKSHAMNLEEVRRVGGDPMILLDGRTRAKIRRAMREYATMGELHIAMASNVVEGLEWFDALEILHQKRWNMKGEPGCFSNPNFVRFHRMMISRNHGNGSAIVMRINIGDSALGYLYGFADKNRFYVYQCGFDYEIVERSSMPGFVCHVHAMRLLANRGLKIYDFMAGFSGYKSALCNVEESMTWTTFRSDSLRFSAIQRVETILEKMRCHKNRIISAWNGVRMHSVLWNNAKSPAKIAI